MQRAKSRRSTSVRAAETATEKASAHGSPKVAARATTRAPASPGGGRSNRTVEKIEIRPATIFSRRTAKRRTPVLHVPHEAVRPYDPPKWMLEECRVAPARAGDQHEILQLLAGLPSPPTKAEFHAAVDHPDHDAANRLVARLPGGRIVGHVEVVPRQVLVCGVAVPAAAIDRVAVATTSTRPRHGSSATPSSRATACSRSWPTRSFPGSSGRFSRGSAARRSRTTGRRSSSSRTWPTRSTGRCPGTLRRASRATGWSWRSCSIRCG